METKRSNNEITKTLEAHKSNSRKRKNPASETDIENYCPSKRHGSANSASAESDTSVVSSPSPKIAHSDITISLVTAKTSVKHEEFFSSDTQSSSDMELYPLGTSPSVFANVLSPLDSTVTLNSWNTKGEKTPHGAKKSPTNRVKVPAYPATLCFNTPNNETRLCPLPEFSWANSKEVWKLMCEKDIRATARRDPVMFTRHPSLQPRMRAILLDWLIEVCEVYKLHRETYYLAVDYLDRFLSAKDNVQKTHLQLIGITCLFLAAKVEEIYPPKIGEFAYVTDGACTDDDILQEELLILSVLDWHITPITVIGWLSCYMQVKATTRDSLLVNAHVNRTTRSTAAAHSVKNQAESFIYPQFSALEFAKTCQLVDLCSLDCNISHFPYSIIAAAAISHTFDSETATRVSGYEWDKIASCAKWMEPYFYVITPLEQTIYLQEQPDQIKSKFGLGHVCPNISTDDSHIIQTHTTSLELFDKAALRRDQQEATRKMQQQEASPAQLSEPPAIPGLLTPPASNRKTLDASGKEIDTNSGLKEIEA